MYKRFVQILQLCFRVSLVTSDARDFRTVVPREQPIIRANTAHFLGESREAIFIHVFSLVQIHCPTQSLAPQCTNGRRITADWLATGQRSRKEAHLSRLVRLTRREPLASSRQEISFGMEKGSRKPYCAISGGDGGAMAVLCKGRGF